MGTAVIVLAVVVPLTTPRADDAASPKERFAALVEACKLAEGQWNERYPNGGVPLLKLDPEEQYKERTARYRGWPAWAFIPEFLALAEKHPEAPEATEALFWIVEKSLAVGVTDREYYPSLKRALELIADRGLFEDRRLPTDRLAHAIRYPSPANERFLRFASEKAKSRELRGQYALCLAGLLIARADYARMTSLVQRQKDPFQTYLADRKMPEVFDYLRKTDVDAANAEAERLLNRIIEEYGDVVVKRRGRETTLAEAARGPLRQILDLARGKVGPEIEGMDLDGKPMKLSDFRGKVVVLSFWGSWCGPSIRMIPHERELVARLAGRPFVLLGVDGDADRGRARRVVDGEKISWHSWFDGEPPGPIAERWQVVACPTFYVLDAKGVIRAKIVADPKALDKAVDAALEELEDTRTR